MKYYHYTVNTGDLAIHNEHAVDKSIMPQIASWLKESTKKEGVKIDDTCKWQSCIVDGHGGSTTIYIIKSGLEIPAIEVCYSKRDLDIYHAIADMARKHDIENKLHREIKLPYIVDLILPSCPLDREFLMMSGDMAKCIGITYMTVMDK